MKTTIATIALVLLSACSPTQPDDPITECDPDGRCWVILDDWSTWAELADEDSIAELEDSGVLEPSPWEGDGECWSLSFADGHVCVVEVDGQILLGRPANELAEAPLPTCDLADPWESGLLIGLECLALVDGIAIDLR